MARVLALVALVAVAAVLQSVACAPLRFDGHKVLRFENMTPEQQALLSKPRSSDGAPPFDRDVWLETPGRLDIRVPSSQFEGFNQWLSSLDITNHHVLIDNVQELIEREREFHLTNPNKNDFFSDYHTVDQINAWLKDLAAAHPDLVNLFSIGTSFENRPIMAVEITSKVSSGAAGDKPGLFFNGAQHAREWISPATLTFVINQLVTKYGNDTRVTQLVDKFVWVIVPVVNVDGYVYTWEHDRMWRKTRSKHSGSSCVGVDPNRNWDYAWCQAGSTSDPCDDIYCGPKAFSEVEPYAISKYLVSHTNLKGYIDFHSFSQLWMGPWGYTSEQPKDVDKQNALAKAATEAIAKTHGKRFDYGPISTTIYPASGNSADFAYGTANITYSYGVELRDTGAHGFILPADQIVPSGEEIFAAVQTMAEFIIAAENL